MSLDPAPDTLTFIGTATTLIRVGPFTLLTDPNFLHRGQWLHIGHGVITRRRTEPAAQPEDLPPLDAVVLSHLHGDHFDPVARRRLDRDVPILTTHHAARRLGRHGFTEVAPLRTWQSETLRHGAATLTVTAVPARHSGTVLDHVLLPPVMGSVLEYRADAEAGPLRVYLSGDTLPHRQLRPIAERFPSLDLAVLHLGGTRVLGVWLSMNDRHGADLLELLEPTEAVPVHHDDYGVFTSPVSNFLVEVAERRLATQVRLLRRGQSLSLRGAD
ncbi:MBL fold metallo-hydrolase [Saccharomonospora xinjiangensis]|uniref:Putative Zn-dependent hydrolase of beta-lactamase fold n=1 Tax=Saccharomonospora xinjiangensis XJ-54 TaxID=882086 RepID=I0UX09_9PSEU|nr:MBL fold metallo-hydrolase [Saccharomonospora xinjiangensis]EID52412.1 putative Zn-dependent hydrolase of beta-lactamase fold [Saccharomonospora xinjiangensis XJ-54]